MARSPLTGLQYPPVGALEAVYIVLGLCADADAVEASAWAAHPIPIIGAGVIHVQRRSLQVR